MTEIPDHKKIESSRIVTEFPEQPMITDEDLMAYADGVLPPERRAIVSATLARDPALMERLASFRFTRGLFARAFDEVLDAPVPERLRAPFGEAAKASVSPAPRRRLGFFHGARREQGPARFYVSALLAASLCLVALGTWLVWFAVPQTRYDFALVDDHSFIRMPAVQSVLESKASKELVAISGRISIRPISTLPTTRGIWCRELELLYSEGPRGLLLACRNADGVWLAPSPTKTYEVANGQSPEETLLATVKGLAGRPVTPDREKRLRDGHWREKP